jgi:serine/threonine-protein kinase
MGAVYQAEHTLMRKRMAIKVLHPEMTRLPEVVTRFEREAMAAAHIDHPNVVSATDFGKLEDGSFFLALEFVEGKSLRELIALGRLELGRALHIARQIGSALARAHQLKIVHRDLKPENVMLVEREGDPDFVKVLDFGIAKVQIGELTAGDVSQAGPGQPVLTQAGMVYGTPEYMAPEQALGQPVDARADLYALGCMMYEMLCGVRPFDAQSKVALLGMQVTAPVPTMATKAPDANIPPEVEALVKHLLAKEAADRVGDAREVIDAISTILTQLVAAGAVQSDFAPPSLRGGTNPGIITGMGSAPDVGALSTVEPQPSQKTSQTALPKLLDGFLTNKSWMIAAGGGLLGILVLVVAIVLLVKGKDTTQEASDAGMVKAVVDSSVVEIAEPSNDEKIEEAISQIDKGNYASGIEALTQLGPEADGREDVHRALMKGYSQTQRPKEALREAALVVKVNPNANLLDASGIALRTLVRDTALKEGQPNADKPSVDEAFALLSGRLGSLGLDDLYGIAYGAPGLAYPKAAARARSDILRANRDKMSPSLQVTVELIAASNSCIAIKNQLDRAAEKGDERTLLELRKLVAPRVQGHWRRVDLLGCIHEGSLNTAISDLEANLTSRKK